jgi:hypothetical protein
VIRWQWPCLKAESLNDIIRRRPTSLSLFPFPPAMPPADDAEKSVPSSSAVEKKDGDKDEDTPESHTLYPILRKKARGFFKFIWSHRMIPILKGILITINHLRRIHLD